MLIYGRGFVACYGSAPLGHVFLMYPVYLKRVSLRADEELGSSLSSSQMRMRRSVKKRTRSDKIFRLYSFTLTLHTQHPVTEGCVLPRLIFLLKFTSDRLQCSISTTEVSVHSIHTNSDLRHIIAVLRTSCPFSQHSSLGPDRTTAGQIVFNRLTNIRNSTD